MYGLTAKIKISFLCSLMFFFILSCKTEHIDSEPQFQIKFFKNKLWKEKEYCFSEIYNNKGKKINSRCIDSLNSTIDLSIDLNNKTSTYILQSKNRKDTVCIEYKINVGRGDDEFKALLNDFKIYYSTFDSLNLQVPQEVNPGNTNEINTINIFL